MPSCGATVTQNLTYLIQDATTNPPTKVCAYTLCPVSESVNRIRLDFTVCNYFFNISVNWILSQVPNNRLGSWHFPFSVKFHLFTYSNWPHRLVLKVIKLCATSASNFKMLFNVTLIQIDKHEIRISFNHDPSWKLGNSIVILDTC